MAKAVFTTIAMALMALGHSTMPSMPRPDSTQQPVKPHSANHLIYDTVGHRMVLLTAAQPPEQEELWKLDGNHWQLIPASGPKRRIMSAAAYDSRRGRIVLFGGIGNNEDERLGDTWEWDGKTWMLMRDSSVGPRDHHSMAYDEARGRSVMYGGQPPDRSWSTDTWEWDGSAWTRFNTPGPGGRVHFAMAYDTKRKQVILFGGFDERYEAHNDLWAWSGRTWQKLSEGGPPARSHHSIAYDSQQGVIVLFGGLRAAKSTDALADTWIWDGQRWREINTVGPARRSNHLMAYDPTRHKTILYGGGSWDGKVRTGYEDLWEWDGKSWLQVGN